jgi:16S rRNA (uracil1498-N3)-methyltransferase
MVRCARGQQAMSAAESPRVRRRFFAPAASLDSERVVFLPREAHHIAHVLRLRPGARLVAFDGAREVDVELDTVSPEVVARRLGTPAPSRRPIEIALLQGVARGPRMDLVVRMATEIGISAIHPVLTSRAVADPAPARVDRWRRIALESARQCGRADLPDIHPPASLSESLAALGPVDLLLVPWEEESRPIGTVLADRACATVAVVIGPEGGLTLGEVDLARRAGGETVSLGPLILRTETAGLVAAAMIIYERLLRPAPR